MMKPPRITPETAEAALLMFIAFCLGGMVASILQQLF